MSPSSADLRIDEVRTEGMHPGDVPREIARHVEVVDGHVAEQPAGGLDVARRGRRRIAAGDDRELEPADLPELEPLAQRSIGGVEATVEADHHDGRSAAISPQQARARSRPMSIGFSHEYRLAGLGRRHDERHVGVGGRGDHHRANVAVVPYLVHAAGAAHAELGRDLLRRLARHVEHLCQPRARVPRDIARVQAADAPAPEYRHAERRHRVRRQRRVRNS